MATAIPTPAPTDSASSFFLFGLFFLGIRSTLSMGCDRRSSLREEPAQPGTESKEGYSQYSQPAKLLRRTTLPRVDPVHFAVPPDCCPNQLHEAMGHVLLPIMGIAYK